MWNVWGELMTWTIAGRICCGLILVGLLVYAKVSKPYDPYCKRMATLEERQEVADRGFARGGAWVRTTTMLEFDVSYPNNEVPCGWRPNDFLVELWARPDSVWVEALKPKKGYQPLTPAIKRAAGL